MELKIAVKVENLQFKYRDGTVALEGVSFTIAEGESVGIIGPNGAGKSTLLMHLNGLLPEPPPTQPSVWIDGLPVIRDNLPLIRRKVGLMFQDPDDQLVWSTVYDDVAFGPRQLGLEGAALDAVVRESLSSVGLSGYETRHPFHLSQGEKRKVCLAGILACKPSILLLDEPTAGLDPRGKRELKRLLSSLRCTKIIATHDLELVLDLCERVILLDGGRVITMGPSVAVLSDEELMLAHGLEKPHALLHRHPHK